MQVGGYTQLCQVIPSLQQHQQLQMPLLSWPSPEFALWMFTGSGLDVPLAGSPPLRCTRALL